MLKLVDEKDFPAAARFAYLNAASIALMPKGVAEGVIDWQRDLAENGTLNFNEAAEEKVFNDLRSAGAALFNCEPGDIAVASSATELMASVAWAVMPPRGSRVIGTEVTHPSTIYPWLRVCRHTGAELAYVSARDAYIPTDRLYDLIDRQTSVVCISLVEYGGGQVYDLKALAEKAHANDALLVVDATQGAGSVPIDVKKTGVDVLITASYKWLCGPFGVAVLYLAPHLQDKLEPGLVGWRSHKEMWDFQATRLEYPDSARRFEFSTMAYGCVIGLTRAVQYLLDVGIERIFAHNQALADRLAGGLEARGGDVLWPQALQERSSIVSVRFPNKESTKIAGHLNANGVMVSPRRDFIRFSPHLYNTSMDIDRALQELDRVLKTT